MLNRVERFALYLIIYAKLIGTMTIGLGCVTMLSLRVKLINEREAWFLTVIIGQLIIAVILSGSTAALGNALFYFSFVPVYLLLKAKRPDTLISLLQTLMMVMLLFSVCEFVILNSPLDRYVWYLPEGHTHRSTILNVQRALGLASISSSSGAVSVLCLSLYTTVAKERVRFYTIVTVATVLVLMSGTGFFLFLAYIVLAKLYNRSSVILKLTGIAFLAGVGAIGFLVTEMIGLNRFTLNYFSETVLVKVVQYAVYTKEFTIASSILGGQANPLNPMLLTTTDFAVMGLFGSMGFVGTLLVLLAPFILIGYRKQYMTLLVLYYLSWLHYPALGSPVGAVFLGLFLSLYRRTVKSFSGSSVRPANV